MNLIHININILISKIDELRQIAKLSRATIIGISESKLDYSILDSEVLIDGYDLLRCDRNRQGGGGAFYMKKDICYNIKNLFFNEIENVCIYIILPIVQNQ